MTDIKHLKSLEYDKILKLLSDKASCKTSAEKIMQTVPSDDYDEVCHLIQMTKDINTHSIKFGTPSLGGISDCRDSVDRAARGGRLSIPELLSVCKALKCIRSIKSWRENIEEETSVDDLFFFLIPNKSLEQTIDKAILNEEELTDTASPTLNEIRTKIRKAHMSIREKLDSIIRSSAYSKVLQESIITMRDGRFVVPVKSENRSEIQGLIHGASSSGATVFIEPTAVVEANNKIKILENEEKQEIDRILLELSKMVGAVAHTINTGFDALVDLDIIFAKSRLADEMNATVPIISKDKIIKLNKARHPLIDKKKVVPINIEMGETFDTLVITGPNTGGKTVALKTLGLLTLMAESGMLLPTGDDSVIHVFENVLADIGDEQSIEQSLSTFSAHITNIISIVGKANDNSLILVDELGAGTDPIEGAALAISIIERFRSVGAMVVATTHYAEIKMYALNTKGVENGSCEFDVTTLSPTYRLLVGVPGRSNAFAISKRLGLNDDIINRAQDLISTDNIRFEDVVDKLEATRQELEREQIAAQSSREQAEYIKKQIEQEKQKLQAQMDKELKAAHEKAQAIVAQVISQTDMLLNELEDIKKQKDKADFAKNLSNAKSTYKSKVNKLHAMADPVINKPQDEYKLPRKLKSGDTVILRDLNSEAIVISGPDSNNAYLVQAGIMKVKVGADNLRLVEKHKPQKKSGGKVTIGNIKSLSNAKTELDIRGYAADEGIMELDQFIDRCVLLGLTMVTVIHGKGTGVLRTAVQKRLKQNRHVKSFRNGVYGEGEAGVTVVELK